MNYKNPFSLQHWIAPSYISSSPYLYSNPVSSSFLDEKSGYLNPSTSFKQLQEMNAHHSPTFNETKKFEILTLGKTENVETYSAGGIWYCGYLVDRNSDIFSMVISTDEQIYLPLASGYSRRKICELATSSMCTIGTLAINRYWSLSPADVWKFENKLAIMHSIRLFKAFFRWKFHAPFSLLKTRRSNFLQNSRPCCFSQS